MPIEPNPTIAVLCHLERLRGDYVADMATFSLNLTVAMESTPARDDVERYLCPWLWTIERFSLVAVQGTTLGPERTVTALPMPAMDSAERDAWIAAVRRMRDLHMGGATTFDAKRFAWDVAAPIASDATARPWHAFLLHVSTFPPPLAQALNLSFVLHVPSSYVAGCERLLAAPHIGFATTPGSIVVRQPAAPQDPPVLGDATEPIGLVTMPGTSTVDPTSTEPWLTRWLYAPASGIADAPAVRAYQRECLLDVKDSVVLPMVDGWLPTPASEDEQGTFAQDWLTGLDDRAAQAFDLPRRLLDTWLNIACQPDLTTPFDEPRVQAGFAVAVLASLRDLAGAGSRPGHDGVPLVETVIRMAARQVGTAQSPTAEDVGVIVRALRAWEDGLSVQVWTALLGDVLVARRVEKGFVLPETTAADPLNTLAARLARTGVTSLALLQELERIHAAVADEAVLRDLLRRQWELALATLDGETRTRWGAIQHVIAAVLESLPLRRQLGKTLLAPAWHRLRGFESEPGKDERRLLVDGLVASLDEYFRDRFAETLVSGDDYSTLAPRVDVAVRTVIDELRDQIAQGLARFANDFGWTRMLDGAQAHDDLPPAQAPDGIVLKVARIGQMKNPDSVESDQDDPLRRISGIGVLLRRTGDPWSCLNHASVHVQKADPAPGDEDDDWSGYDQVVADALVPSRLAYRDGMRQALLSYDNQPLVAEGAAQEMTTGRFAGSRRTRNVDAFGQARLFRYGNPYGSKDGSPLLPPLTFGATYEAAAFAVGNGGELPPALAATSAAGVDPRRMRTDLATVQIPAGCIRTGIPYLRRVPVGAVRVDDPTLVGREPGKAMASIPLPPIPEGVKTVARSIAPPSVGLADGPEEPLLLLAPPVGEEWAANVKRRFAFAIRPPAVDLNVWERWENGKAGTDARARRADVWARYFELSDEAADKKATTDLTIDDPAPSKYVLALTRVFPAAAAGTTPPRLELALALGAASGASGLGRVQAKGTLVEIESLAKGGTAALAAKGSGAIVRVPEQEVWRLEIFSFLDEDARRRMHTCTWGDTAAERATNRATGLVAPLRLLVEVATSELPTSAELFDALSAQARPDHDAYQLGIVPATPGAVGTLRWLHRVEFLAQRWRWQGRPITGFDFAAFAKHLESDADTIDGPLSHDDAVLFGDRDSDDHLRQAAWFDLLSPVQRTPLLEHDVSSSPTALYYRFAVRAWSRYEGLLRSPRAVDSRDATIPGGKRSPFERWRHLLLKCRLRAAIPAPAVKLVVPLTEPLPAPAGGAKPTTTASRTPGLLVVLSEPWYAIGGLAEELRVRVATVPRLTSGAGGMPSDTKDRLLEVGPDPIVETGRTVPAVNGDPEVLIEPIGPIGFTFDTDTTAPLFVNASYIVPPPDVEPAQSSPSDDLSWFFVKLSFQRRLHGDGVVGDGTHRDSASTAPVWAQLLPPFSSFGWNYVDDDPARDTIAAAELGLAVEPGSGAIVLCKTSLPTKPMPVCLTTRPIDEHPDHHHELILYVLLTTVLNDALGRAGQECYRGLFTISSTGALERADQHDPPVADELPQLRARIIEVQRRASPPEPGERDVPILEQLFPPRALGPDDQPLDVPPADATARIVRVSEPIPPVDFPQ